ncbi:MAG: S41 family peptidase, partial [Planctomycetes bacterium]|nr:S41 family peptidase [Planctomycetota bacterium]
LALRCADLLGAAQDPHVQVTWLEATVPTFQRPVVANIDLRSITLAFPKARRIGRIGMVARTDDDIGYLMVNSFAREQRDDFERALQALRGLLDCKAIVLDVRLNGGGDESLARRLAGFFVRGEKVYARQRVRDPRIESEFREVDDRKVQGHPVPDIYRGPVAVLMGPLDMSSTEAFLLMMKQATTAVLVGERSYGSSGNPQQHALVPGLVVHLPSWQALRPDGTCFEGEGIAPHIHVPAEPKDFYEKDPVLEEALLRLRGQR